MLMIIMGAISLTAHTKLASWDIELHERRRRLQKRRRRRKKKIGTNAVLITIYKYSYTVKAFLVLAGIF